MNITYIYELGVRAATEATKQCCHIWYDITVIFTFYDTAVQLNAFISDVVRTDIQYRK